MLRIKRSFIFFILLTSTACKNSTDNSLKNIADSAMLPPTVPIDTQKDLVVTLIGNRQIILQGNYHGVQRFSTHTIQ